MLGLSEALGSVPRARGRVGASGSMSIGMDALLPRDDPAPFFLVMVGVTSRHLLAAEVYWTGLSLLEPFFFASSYCAFAPCLSCLRERELRNKCDCFSRNIRILLK